MMKILSIAAILLIPIAVGVLIRIFVRKKPKTELVIWGILMTAMLLLFVYSLVLVVKQGTPLFTKHHMANEGFVISSVIFLVIGFINIRIIKNSLQGRHDEPATSEKKNEE